MNMKRQIAIAGIALVVSILLSAPTIAEPGSAEPASIVWVFAR